jgi:hypothetical protein
MKLRIPVLVLFPLLVISACSRNHTPQINVNFNYMFNNGNQSLKLEQDRVIITNDQGHQAVVTQQGTLTIEDKVVAVPPQVRDRLVQYVQTTQQIKQQGIEVAKRAGGFALGILSEVFGGLLSGKSEQDIEHNANQSAAKFKKSVLPICDSVQKLKQLQDTIATEVPAFEPYAVIEDKDSNDCVKGINSPD